MDLELFRNLTSIMNKKNITKLELISSFYAKSISEVAQIIGDFIDNNVIELLERCPEFYDNYHLFLYELVELCEIEDDVLAVKNLINKNIKSIRDITKEYNKGNKDKDSLYNILTRISKLIKSNKSYMEDFPINDDNSEEYKIIWFVINVLRTPDYLFRLLEVNPDYANLRDCENNHIFLNYIKEYIASMKKLDDSEIKKYKRIITMFLESDNLRLSNTELFSLLEMLENNLSIQDLNDKRNIMFVQNEIERHYEIINSDSRLIAPDYANIPCPRVIIRREGDERVDLTHLFTFSIDSVRGKDTSRILIDDSISIENTLDGINLYVHVPDVDYFVPKDSETDKYMRNIGETIYAKDYRAPMLNYDIAKMCSLVHGEKRAAITFIIKIDFNGKILDIDFKKSIINVNYNLSRSYAEMFYHSDHDPALKKALHTAKYYATRLRKNRGETVGKMKMSSLVMEEFNVIVDMVVADYFNDKEIVFPYKNYLGKRSVRTAKDVSKCESFNLTNEISPEGRNILYSIFDIYNRIYYDTEALPNSSFGGHIAGNVGNPMREYISLETDRLIKDLIISGEHNEAYWEERILRDCIEYTETSSKIKELYTRR